MSDQILLYGLGIIGVFGTLALSINGFFLKGIYDDLNTLKMTTIESVTNGNNREKRLQDVEDEIKALREKFHFINTELSHIKSLELLRGE
jgi:hypothetical protein